MIHTTTLTGDSAVFDDSERHRFLLTRELGGARTLLTIGLNPSTATAEKSDHTIRREIGLARSLGFGRLVKVNLFSLRSTDPRGLLDDDSFSGIAHDQIKARYANFETIRHRARTADAVVCCWGVQRSPRALRERVEARARDVEAMLRGEGIELHALAFTADGVPRHPLFLPSTSKLVPWERS